MIQSPKIKTHNTPVNTMITTEQFEALQQRVTALEEKLKTRNTKGQTLDDMTTKIRDAIDNTAHPILSGDILSARDILLVLQVLLPEYEDQLNRPNAERLVGKCLGKIGTYQSKVASSYIQYDNQIDEPTYKTKGDKQVSQQRGKRVVIRVWVLRNQSKYKHMGPADLYRAYRDQQRIAGQRYHEALQRMDEGPEAAEQDQEVSFI